LTFGGNFQHAFQVIALLFLAALLALPFSQWAGGPSPPTPSQSISEALVGGAAQHTDGRKGLDDGSD
jgi:hypothetical protein